MTSHRKQRGTEKVLYKDDTLAGNEIFEAIVRHPYAADRRVLLIGAADWRSARLDTADNLFQAWYDCIVFSSSIKIIGKLERASHANDK